MSHEPPPPYSRYDPNPSQNVPSHVSDVTPARVIDASPVPPHNPSVYASPSSWTALAQTLLSQVAKPPSTVLDLSMPVQITAPGIAPRHIYTTQRCAKCHDTGVKPSGRYCRRCPTGQALQDLTQQGISGPFQVGRICGKCKGTGMVHKVEWNHLVQTVLRQAPPRRELYTTTLVCSHCHGVGFVR
jgi:hypothetical protein